MDDIEVPSTWHISMLRARISLAHGISYYLPAASGCLSVCLSIFVLAC